MKKVKLATLIDDASLALLQCKEGEANILLSKVYDELLALAPSIPADNLALLSQMLEIMHDAQQRRDYVYLVDMLKYSLPKVINY